MSRSIDLQHRARKRIPGSTQLLSKRPEMFAPEQWPGYYSRAKGVDVWDIDDRHYIDMSISGIGANVLGYCDPDVDAAVIEAIRSGNSTSLNCPEEVELADLMTELHTWGGMVRYTRCGGESMAVAVRIARAHTDRDKIAFCGYHGWHDWYLSANLTQGNELEEHLLPGLEPQGVPRGLAGTALPFHYNDLDGLRKIMEKNQGEIAAIVMEPIRSDEPVSGFLEGVRDLANEHKAVLVFDEITAAFRMNNGGAHLLYGIEPDIAVFAKGISNGYPMGVVFGKESVMESAQSTFISSTYWTERIGPVAALATIRKYCDQDVSSKLMETGRKIQQGWRNSGLSRGLNLHVSGIYPLSHFSFDYPDSSVMMTLFVQIMLEKGFLASGRFYATYAHKDEHIKAYLQAVDEAFKAIRIAMDNGSLKNQLKGPVAHSGFKRLT